MLRRKIKHKRRYGDFWRGYTVAILNKENLTEVTVEYNSEDERVSSSNI